MLSPTDLKIRDNIHELMELLDLFKTSKQKCFVVCLVYEYLQFQEVVQFINKPRHHNFKTAAIKNANELLVNSNATNDVIDICTKFIAIMNEPSPLPPVPLLSQYAPVRRSARIAAQNNNYNI